MRAAAGRKREKDEFCETGRDGLVDPEAVSDGYC